MSSFYSVTDDKLFDDGNLIVKIRHDAHTNEICEPYHCFSYFLSLEKKTIVYSGDVKSITELQVLYALNDLLIPIFSHC